MLKKQDINAQMSQMGLKPTDTVVIHTSMRAIGEVEGGPDGLIDAFCEYLCDGLFIVPTHSWDDVVPENPYYDVCNNISSLYVARDYIGNAIILDGDQIIYSSKIR